jgi:hypothetical protein
LAVEVRKEAAGVGVERNKREIAKGPRPPSGSIEKGRMDVPVDVSSWMSICPMQCLVSLPKNLAASTVR